MKVTPLAGWPLGHRLFPDSINLCRAKGSEASDQLAFLIHGLAQNEDYFGLLVPHLLAKGYDVWALRLPGYVAAGEKPDFWPPALGMELLLSWYGWVAASAFVHLQQTLTTKPGHTLAWGHSMGGAILAAMVADERIEHRPTPDRLVFEAPAFGECLTPFSGVIAGSSLVPDDVVDKFARILLMDDLYGNVYTQTQFSTCVPGHTSRTVFNMNVLALINPLNRFPKHTQHWLTHSRFLIGRFDRLVDAEKLVALLDSKNVPKSHRLVLLKNHLLSLSSAEEMVEWLKL